jgi:hypothetical protein
MGRWPRAWGIRLEGRGRIGGRNRALEHIPSMLARQQRVQLLGSDGVCQEAPVQTTWPKEGIIGLPETN